MGGRVITNEESSLVDTLNFEFMVGFVKRVLYVMFKR